jgi:hypothetical protein
MQGEPKRFFSFSYFVKPESDRDLHLHQLRDGQAFSELAAVLAAQGHCYGGLILNYPGAGEKATMPEFGPSDILVMAGRPPLSDDEHSESKLAGRKRIERSHTDLEELIFANVRRYFEISSRKVIKLTKEMADKLPVEAKCKAEIQFCMGNTRTANYARYRMYGSKWWQNPLETNRTATYLLYTPPLWDNGPSLVASFGLSGPENLIWNHLVRVRHSELLESPRFVMAEMELDDIPHPPTSLAFADDWKIDIILNLQNTSGPKADH